MRGMKALAETRRAGFKPAMVFVDVDAGPGSLPSWLQWQHNTPHRANVEIEAADALLRIDWRPLVGMVVNVSGQDPDRVRTVAHAIRDAGATRVVYAWLRNVGDDECPAFLTEWIFDTDGLIGPKEQAHGAHADA